MFKLHKDDIINGVRDIAKALPSLAAAFLAAIGLIVPALSKLADWIFPDAEEQGNRAQRELDRGTKIIHSSGHVGPGSNVDTETPLTEQEKTDLQSKVARGAAIKSLHDAQNAGLSSQDIPIPNPPADYTTSGEKPLGQVAQQKHLQVATQHLDVLQIIQRGIEQQNTILGQIKTNTGKPIILPPNASGGN